MADTKITALTALTGADPANDVIPIVDVSDTTMAASGTTKKISVNNILGASGTATLASATITGNLTVDTNTFFVDSANNRVGVGTATPAAGAALSVLGTTSVSASNYTVSSTWASRFQAAANNQPSGIFLSGLTSSGAVVPGSLHVEPVAASSRSALIATYAADSAVGYFAINRFSPSAGTTSQHFKIDDTGVATWSNVGGVAGTAMTLNSTGLGVGVASPAQKVDVSGAVLATNVYLRSDDSDVSWGAGAGSRPIIRGNQTNNTIKFYTASTDRMTLDSSGNVGIGVTPSAWGSGYKALQLGNGLSLMGSTINATIAANAWFDGTNWKYISANPATLYYGSYAGNGSHVWSISSGVPSAGGNVSLTNAMTLDASGNLLVGTTDTSSTSGAGFKIIGSGLGPYVVNAASTNAALAYTMYSTGAAAYRFYVGWGGTVFATNTTISAISDARLKENVQDIDVGLGAILALKPRKFDWKAGKGKDIKGDRGFIAQEFEQVFPQLVDEWKDAAPEGEAPYKSVRQDLIPVLVKAIQELAAEVNALKNA